MSTALHTSALKSLPLLARGKVRDNYAVGDDRILMVASDRISAFDVIMGEPIPGKGALLTTLSLFWFDQLGPKGLNICPIHLTGEAPESVVSAERRTRSPAVRCWCSASSPSRWRPWCAATWPAAAGRNTRKAARSAACQLPEGLQNASKLPEPIYTPAAKAEMGEHDENITYEKTVEMVGADIAAQIRDKAIALYKAAAEIALKKGIIIADTKFEFGLDKNGTVVLMDEVLTPDSSRYWPADQYAVGSNPPSFDKQFLRDWLETAKVNGQPWDKAPPAPRLPREVIEKTAAKYQEALTRLMG